MDRPAESSAREDHFHPARSHQRLRHQQRVGDHGQLRKIDKQLGQRLRGRPRTEKDGVAGADHLDRCTRYGSLLSRSLARLFRVAGLMADGCGQDRAAASSHDQTVLGHGAQVAPDRDLGRPELAGHLGDGNDSARAQSLGDDTPAFDGEHAADRTSSINFDQ